jgi:hypothetical protein
LSGPSCLCLPLFIFTFPFCAIAYFPISMCYITRTCV